MLNTVEDKRQVDIVNGTIFLIYLLILALMIFRTGAAPPGNVYLVERRAQVRDIEAAAAEIPRFY